MNLSAIKAKLASLFQSGLAKDTMWMLFSKLFNIVIQAIYFIIVARLLGTENYGSFVVIAAVASIVFPFVPLGSEHLLVKNVALDRASFNTYWGNSLVILICNGILFTIILLLLSPLIFPSNVQWWSILMILLSDLIGLALLDLGLKALLSANMVDKLAQLGVLGTCSKLLAALCLAVFFEQPSLDIWSYLYFASSVVMGIVTIVLVNRMVGMPRPVWSVLKSNISQGLDFSIGTSANNINSNLDKSMLGKLSSVTAAGIYGSAYRFIDVGIIPLLALFGATYTRFFQHGTSGIKGSLGFAKRLMPMMVLYAIATLAGYWIFAPYIPVILGEEYRDAIGALLWLSPIPAITTLQYLAADTLTGAGYQKTRSRIQVIAAIVNILLNIILIPRFGWKGAAWATLTSDVLRLICLWLMVFWLYRKQQKQEHFQT